jgi:hypothetical protein
VGDRVEQLRSRRQVEGPHAIEPVGDQVLQRIPSGVAHRIETHEMQTGDEAGHDLVDDPVRADEDGQRLDDRGAKSFVRELVTRDADDPRRIGDLAVEIAQVERRKQLAIGEIAGPAEDDQVERIDGDDPAGHVRLLAAPPAHAKVRPCRSSA